ncbi:hypothetical protein [Deinococcus yavapaiensis]|uniref:hypothetical protein n=1 Tax=Deinococcus yavapaiensis TaxID=309889 RepID=UPI000DA1A7C2|nr:hypothetical protein [Deinococcus yavapaiensis]
MSQHEYERRLVVGREEEKVTQSTHGGGDVGAVALVGEDHHVGQGPKGSFTQAIDVVACVEDGGKDGNASMFVLDGQSASRTR